MDVTLQTLIQLQSVDTVIRDLQKKIEGLPHVIQQLDQLIIDQEQKVVQIQANIEEQERIRRGKELEIESNLEKVTKYQGQLLQIKTNKEYSALLSEIKALKTRNSLGEDDILELMESVDRAKSALAASRKELAEAQQRVQQEKLAKELEKQELEQELARHEHTKDQMTAHVDSGILKEYTKLFNLRNGVVVSAVRDDGVCTGCFVALTPQMFSDVRTGEHIHRCPVCLRFLYWGDAESGDVKA